MTNQRALLGGSLALGALLLLGSCSTSQQAENANNTSPADRPNALGAQNQGSPMQGMTVGGVTLTPFDDSPKFPTAALRLNTPVAGSTAPSPVQFSYDLTNFQLTKMTGSDHAAMMANSMKGQHIHLIIDNQPYIAEYETKFAQPIADGKHVILSFLSRSYHESLKHRGAYDLRVISVGNTTAPADTAAAFDVKAPALFYSRPKDAYKGKDAAKIMLDFYLVNTTLSPDGNKVRATINGNEFMLDKWLPYQMEGLPAGQATIKLELVDSSGKLIPGRFNSVTRTISVEPGA